jgi:hypothetical protein
LSFCNLTQDGDTEGCLRLFDLPTPEQAVAIRKALGLKRKRAAHAGSFAGFNLASANRGVSGAPASEKLKAGLARMIPRRPRKILARTRPLTSLRSPNRGAGEDERHSESQNATIRRGST